MLDHDCSRFESLIRTLANVTPDDATHSSGQATFQARESRVFPPSPGRETVSAERVLIA
jgi:hypothetical protein